MAKKQQKELARKSVNMVYGYIFIAFMSILLSGVPFVLFFGAISLLLACYEVGKLSKIIS